MEMKNKSIMKNKNQQLSDLTDVFEKETSNAIVSDDCSRIGLRLTDPRDMYVMGCTKQDSGLYEFMNSINEKVRGVVCIKGDIPRNTVKR